jgi:hypothetical protein
MKFANHISDELMEIVTPYTEWFFSQTDHHMLKEPDRVNGHTWESATSEDYLNHVVRKDGDHIGYPEVGYCCDIGTSPDVPKHHREKQQKLNRELISILGARNNAVHVYYPEGGFMGWHTNWNAHGYNILLTYNPEEHGGYFRYRDPVTKEIVTLWDPKGWSVKVGYFGRRSETDKVWYHCAGSKSKRLTLGYVIPDEAMWKMMVEDITGQDFDSLKDS